jgi:NADH:ubiquinone oxidoreductase subunit F (NADH-binding)
VRLDAIRDDWTTVLDHDRRGDHRLVAGDLVRADDRHNIGTVRHVDDDRTPGVGEVDLGTTLRTAIDQIGGGFEPGRSVKAVFPGVANAVVTAADVDVPLTYEGFEAIGSGMGSAGFIVYDDRTCMVDTATALPVLVD